MALTAVHLYWKQQEVQNERDIAFVGSRSNLRTGSGMDQWKVNRWQFSSRENFRPARVMLFSVAVGTPVYLAPSGATSWGGECDTLLCNSSFPCSIPSSSMFSQLNASCDIVFSAGDYSNAHLQWSSNAKLVNLTFGFSTFLDGFTRQRSQEKLLSSLESDFTANLRLTLHLNAENVGTPGNGPLDASFILHGISTHKHALNSVIISLGANGDLDAEISGLSFNSSSLALKSPGSAEADIEQCDFAFGSQSNSPLDMTSYTHFYFIHITI